MVSAGDHMKRKRALIFIEDGSFTYDNRVKREADALVADGWDVTVISPKYPEDRVYRRANAHLRSYHYPKPNAESALGHIVEHSISLVLGTCFTAWVALRHGFTVFHACNPMDTLWVIAWPYKLLGKRFIFDQHDLCPEVYLSRGEQTDKGPFYRALMILERQSYRLADAVIATNESYKEMAVQRGGKLPADVFIVRNGPNLERIRKAAPRDGLKRDGEVLVGYLGNMNMQDGVDLLLLAAERIVKTLKRDDIKFILVGGGSSQASLVEQAEAMGLAESMTFTGRIPDDDMLGVLNACDICVQPDPRNPLNDVSTMNKVMEYMALEKPVVAFDLKETRVSGGDAVLYAEPNDTSDLADKIVYLADQPEKRAEMGRAGHERVLGSLAWRYSVPHLRAAYAYSVAHAVEAPERPESLD